MMKVKEAMRPHVEFVRSSDTIKQAAEKMKEQNTGALLVILGEEAVGILTDRDIVLRSAAQGLDPEKHTIIEVFSEGIVSCREEDDISVVVDLMQEKQIRRVIVKDKEGKVVGIISLDDLAAKIQREASQTSQPTRS
jgi:CBS domain-containing protein